MVAQCMLIVLNSLFVRLIHKQIISICSHSTENFIKHMYNWNQYCNFGEAQTVSTLMMVYVNRNMLGQVILTFFKYLNNF